MVYDMLWSDPSTPDQEEKHEIDHGGFGLSPRGCGCFGDRSIDIFLEKYHFQVSLERGDGGWGGGGDVWGPAGLGLT